MLELFQGQVYIVIIAGAIISVIPIKGKTIPPFKT